MEWKVSAATGPNPNLPLIPLTTSYAHPIYEHSKIDTDVEAANKIKKVTRDVRILSEKAHLESKRSEAPSSKIEGELLDSAAKFITNASRTASADVINDSGVSVDEMQDAAQSIGQIRCEDARKLVVIAEQAVAEAEAKVKARVDGGEGDADDAQGSGDDSEADLQHLQVQRTIVDSAKAAAETASLVGMAVEVKEEVLRIDNVDSVVTTVENNIVMKEVEH